MRIYPAIDPKERRCDLLAIDFKNVFMFQHGYDMRCKICNKLASRDFSCSERGVNCVCDNCREKLCEIFQISSCEMLIKIQDGGKKIIDDLSDNEDLFKKEGE